MKTYEFLSTCYELFRAYIQVKWPRAAGETRKSTLDALATVAPALVSDVRDAPDATGNCKLPDLCKCGGDCSCDLPGSAWGLLVLAKSRPGPGKLYTDSGETHDDKGLKRRPVGDKRFVPIPPDLVRILVEHLEEFGVAEDGRLFWTSSGGTVSASAVWRIWRDARVIGLPPEQEVTPLAGRPYDLRHACATLLLNAGVPPKEVAQRLGHSVDVLWKVYAGCLDGDEERINRMIERALAA